MASFSAGTTFTDGVANDVTAAKLAALVNNATPTSGLIQDRTAETIIATNDAFLFGDASDSNNLKRITVANFTQTLPTAKVTTGTIVTATLGTTTGTAATFTTLTAGTTTSTAATIPTLTAGTTTGTAATFSGDLTIADKIIHSGDTNTTIRFPAADTVTVETAGTERVRVDSSGNVGIGTTTTSDAGVTITKSITRDNGWDAKLALQSTGSDDYPTLLFSGCSATNRYGAIVQTASTSGSSGSPITSSIEFINTSATQGEIRFFTNDNVGTTSPSERLRLDSSGNVGIGTNNPTNRLTVRDATDISMDANGSGQFRVEGSGYSTVIAMDATGSFIYNTGSGRAMAFGVNEVERLRIDSDGDVSIGTATALSKLHVHGNITLSNTTTATSAGTGGLSKPATYAGYLTVSINGTSRKIPYYAT